MSEVATFEIDEAVRDGEYFNVVYEIQFLYTPPVLCKPSGAPYGWIEPESANTEILSVYTVQVIGEHGIVELSDTDRDYWEEYFYGQDDHDGLDDTLIESAERAIEAQEEMANERIREDRENYFI